MSSSFTAQFHARTVFSLHGVGGALLRIICLQQPCPEMILALNLTVMQHKVVILCQFTKYRAPSHRGLTHSLPSLLCRRFRSSVISAFRKRKYPTSTRPTESAVLMALILLHTAGESNNSEFKKTSDLMRWGFARRGRRCTGGRRRHGGT